MPIALALGWSGAVAWAADNDGLQRRLSVEPSLSLSQAYTDNYALSAVAPQADSVTRVTAGIGLRSNAGAVRGYLDYALTGVLYARHSDRNSLQNGLRANVSAELIDNRLQLLGTASIERSAISAFGVQPGSGTDASGNTTEVRTIQLTPTWRGYVGPDLRYSAALGYNLTTASAGGIGDSSSTTALVHLEPSSNARLRWTVDAAHLQSNFKLGRSSSSNRVYGGLLLSVDDLDLQLRSTAGYERSNLASLTEQGDLTWGVGVAWVPSPVTRVSAEMENRFFGRTYAVSIEHRTPRTIFSYRSSRSLSTGTGQGAGGRGTVFDLLFALRASAQPDPVLRADLINKDLRDAGINPALQINAGFLQSAASVQDQQQLSAAWTGPRSTAVLTWTSTSSRRVDSASTALDDLSGNAELRQHGLFLSLNHRLTPQSSAALQLGSQRGSGTLQQASGQRLAEVQYTTVLTADSTVVVALRRALYVATARAYDENAITATYGLRF